MFASSGMMDWKLGRSPQMLWKMLQELGYEKHPKYFGTQVTYEGSESSAKSKSTSLLPSPSEEFMRWKRSMQPLHQDVLSMLEFVMLHVKHTRSPVHTISSSWMEKSMLISLNAQAELPTSMLNLYKTDMNFKIKKHVVLTAIHTKELDSTIEEVEFWQGKTKWHYPQD
jgi:hypothetical protein